MIAEVTQALLVLPNNRKLTGKKKINELQVSFLTTLSFQALNMVTNVTGRVESSWRVRSNKALERINKTQRNCKGLKRRVSYKTKTTQTSSPFFSGTSR